MLIKLYMNCEKCNNIFTQKSKHHKFCCGECRDTHYIETHKKEKQLYDKRYREKNKEKKRLQDKMWRENNKSRKAKNNRLWRKKNPESNRLSQYKDYHKNKKHNPNFKLRKSIRDRIYSALKGNSKTSSSLGLLGCSVNECWNHLENKFKPGMTRENHGSVWHIDHIKPCCAFDLSKESEQKKCFHYTNLQPLFIEENLKKSGRY